MTRAASGRLSDGGKEQKAKPYQVLLHLRAVAGHAAVAVLAGQLKGNDEHVAGGTSNARCARKAVTPIAALQGKEKSNHAVLRNVRFKRLTLAPFTPGTPGGPGRPMLGCSGKILKIRTNAETFNTQRKRCLLSKEASIPKKRSQREDNSPRPSWPSARRNRAIKDGCRLQMKSGDAYLGRLLVQHRLIVPRFAVRPVEVALTEGLLRSGSDHQVLNGSLQT